MTSIPIKIEDSKLVFNDMSMHRFLEKNDGRWCDLVPRIPKRSLSQNAYYWTYLTIIAAETGDNADDLHEFFKRKFLNPKFIQVLGQEIRIPSSTTGLSKADFTEYLDRICALTNVPLPDPEAAGFILNKKPI